MYSGKLRTPHYENIRDGRKIYELRIYDEKRKIMNVGDLWIFKHENNKNLPEIRTQIQEIRLFDSFENAIKNTELNKLLPEITNVEDAVNLYNDFPGFEENSKKYGVVRFLLSVVS